ncbi:NodT family efflux transporter outer membrane factor (OMF) lipoprotein [Endobacter medicaginis]|uniref:Efflux transporter outer membrane subunit n=1 Tax=Endobacter medicaginis TaxID=1181271 RepID=A0A850NTE8_9PROT|nr:efflux transporter outer membrane subunit [Endobacter medicaginis]MBB3172336.1 NodT family efflux transporter outer membrane factor (OMF) lipoprotein [Endobacter medicaginis]MCX5476686.1 efflux transporter outer membrane subunit [Endobacter medicaginis]NVN30682.1 efflux transporter outer membrane subunit [Endobacter medicaginis]
MDTVRLHRLCLGVTLLLGGCTVGPDYRPDRVDLPHGFNAAPDGDVGAGWTRATHDWWAQLGDPVLNDLVEIATRNNLDIREASAHLLAERELRARDEAALSPQVSVGAQAGNLQYSTATEYPPGLTGVDSNTRFWGYSLNVSWELDVFGRVRRGLEARDASVDALEAQRRGVLLATVSELVSDYAALRAAQARREVALANLRSTRDSAALVQRLYARGLANTLQTAEAQTEVDRARATIAPFDTVATQARDAIAVLLGRPPEAIGVDLNTPRALPTPPPLPAVLPSMVVANRPDIRVAERRYAEATARIGVAVAALYPDFTVPLTFDPSSAMIHTLMTTNALAWSALLSATAPLYTGGRLSAQVKAARAEAEAARLDYQHTIIRAFAEVEDALAAFHNEATRQGALADAVRDSSAALDRSERLYGAGLTGYLDVLSAQRSAYAARDARITSQLALMSDAVNTYRAIGAGWQGISVTETTLPVPHDEQARWAKHWRPHV